MKSFEVRVNTVMDERGYPKYDVLGRYSDRKEAAIALAQYNQNPYDLSANKITFAEVYEKWYEKKYELSKKKYSESSKNCSTAAYKNCSLLHERIFKELRAGDLQAVLDNCPISEFLGLKKSNVSMEALTMQGGVKTRASKNRIVPIHHKIIPFMQRLLDDGSIQDSGKPFYNSHKYVTLFRAAIKKTGIKEDHTPHDCRHTCASLLASAGAEPVCVKRILGHTSGGDITESIYTHKSIEELRKNIELIP